MSNDDTTYTVRFNADGQPVDMDGTRGLTGRIDTRNTGATLEVHMALDPIGDDAIYAGRIEAHYILHAPGKPDAGLDVDEAATKGAEWSAQMIAAVAETAAEVLPQAFEHAAKNAKNSNAGRVQAMVGMIATILVAAFDGDGDKAKDAARRLMDGEVVSEFGDHALDIPPHLSDADKARMLGTLNEAIDMMVSVIG